MPTLFLQQTVNIFLVHVPLFFSWHLIPTAIVSSSTSQGFVIQTKLIKTEREYLVFISVSVSVTSELKFMVAHHKFLACEFRYSPPYSEHFLKKCTQHAHTRLPAAFLSQPCRSSNLVYFFKLMPGRWRYHVFSHLFLKTFFSLYESHAQEICCAIYHISVISRISASGWTEVQSKETTGIMQYRESWQRNATATSRNPQYRAVKVRTEPFSLF